MQTASMGDQESQWEQAQQSLQELDEYVCGAVGREELHEVEHEVFRRLLGLGRIMMHRFVAESGTGYTPGRPPCTLSGEPLGYKGIETVDYLTIFGPVPLPRAAYAHPDGGYVPPMARRWTPPARRATAGVPHVSGAKGGAWRSATASPRGRGSRVDSAWAASGR